jgi:hypothetical protein
MLIFHSFNIVRSVAGRVLLIHSLSIMAATHSLWALAPAAPTSGFAWQIKGTWQIEGKGRPIQTGDAVEPGALLRPDPAATRHSIVILLPDGQSVGYSCFTVNDCARGFRVPDLYRAPEPFAVDMLARVRSVLIRGDLGFSAASDAHLPTDLPRDEILAVLGPGNQVNVKGLAAKLPDGHFTYDLRPIYPSRQTQFHVLLVKNGPSINLRLPSTGLYFVTIDDDENNPRIRLFLAVVSPAQEASFRKSFNDAKEHMAHWNDDWNNDFGGWPIHDFQWAFLESLITQPQPASDFRSTATAHGATARELAGSQSAATGRPTHGVTAEPTFSPQAGLLVGAADIVLRSQTPDAIIHYTVDTSEPNASSPVYRAPIVIKHAGLVIKAFAAAKGEKDSAVVTGSFRIGG